MKDSSEIKQEAQSMRDRICDSCHLYWACPFSYGICNEQQKINEWENQQLIRNGYAT